MRKQLLNSSGDAPRGKQQIKKLPKKSIKSIWERQKTVAFELEVPQQGRRSTWKAQPNAGCVCTLLCFIYPEGLLSLRKSPISLCHLLSRDYREILNALPSSTGSEMGAEDWVVHAGNVGSWRTIAQLGMGWFRARKTTEYLQLPVFAQEVEMSLRTKLAITLPPSLRTVIPRFFF